MELDFSPLTEDEIASAIVPDPTPDAEPIMPVPPGTPEMDYRLSDGTKPVATWSYQDPSGDLLGYIGRFEHMNGTKTFLPITYCRVDGEPKWYSKGFPAPYPIYNAPELATRASNPVLVVHGEKAAEAAKVLFPNFVVTTSPFGFALAHNANWAALSGRDVLVSPDYCEEMHEIVDKYVDLAHEADARSVRVLWPKVVARAIREKDKVALRPNVPAGWDLASAREEGWSSQSLNQLLGDWQALPMEPRHPRLSQPGSCTFELKESGLWAIFFKDEERHETWICGELILYAEVRDEAGENWAKKFRLRTRDRKVKEILIPASLSAGDAVPLREHLLSAGLNVASGKQAREFLTEYIARCGTDRRILQVARLGWHDGAFAIAKQSFGKHPSGEPVEFAGSETSKVGQVSGTREVWLSQIAFPSEMNSRLAFAISCALAAPLIHLVNGESGGFHLVGSSSIGKTTALQVAGSVWGGGGTEGYIKTWRATSNGLEGIAAAHCDVLLCLDELGQVKGAEAGQCAYMLANGTGKIRANRFGAARPAATWRVMILSSGEVPLQVKIAEDRTTAHAAAGQLVRFVDLSADAAKGLGMFENLGSETSANALALSLRRAANENFGHIGPAFVQHVTKNLDSSRSTAEKEIAAFLDSLKLPDDADGQVRRVARRFALVAAGGEIAAAAGILPWNTGSAAIAARLMFREWLSARGDAGPLEDRHAIIRVKSYIERFGVNFEEDADGDRPVQPKVSVGFVETINDKKHYCFFTDAWQKTVCKGLDA